MRPTTSTSCKFSCKAAWKIWSHRFFQPPISCRFFPHPKFMANKKKCDNHHLPWKTISKMANEFKLWLYHYIQNDHPKSFGPGDWTTNSNVLKQCIWVFQTFPPRGSYVLSAADVGGWTWGNGEVNKNCFVEHAYKIDVKKCFASQKKIITKYIELFQFNRYMAMVLLV